MTDQHKVQTVDMDMPKLPALVDEAGAFLKAGDRGVADV